MTDNNSMKILSLRIEKQQHEQFAFAQKNPINVFLDYSTDKKLILKLSQFTKILKHKSIFL